jgi:plasmid stabilization system protein ParE
VAGIVFAPQVADDLERILDHLVRHGVDDAAARIDAVLQAIDVLSGSPEIGRPVAGGQHERVVGRGARGYLVRYRFEPRIDTAFVLAIRGQHERPGGEAG